MYTMWVMVKPYWLNFNGLSNGLSLIADWSSDSDSDRVKVTSDSDRTSPKNKNRREEGLAGGKIQNPATACYSTLEQITNNVVEVKSPGTG